MADDRPPLVLSAQADPVHVPGDALGRSYTPDPVAVAVVAALDWWVPRRVQTVLEPCVGGGAFVRAARARWPGVHVVGTDLDPGAPGASLCDRFSVADAARRQPGHVADVAVTNPPFGKAVGQAVTLAIVAAARRASTVCGLVLPLDYLTQTGFEGHVRECLAVHPLLPRPFPHERGMCLYVWGPAWPTGVEGRAALELLRWK